MTPRWAIERDFKNNDHELLQIVTIYAEGENAEFVKKDNKPWTHKRRLILVEGEE